MTISDTKKRELYVDATNCSSVLTSTALTTTALGIVLTIAQYAALEICEKPPGIIRLAGTESTLARPHSPEVNELDVFGQINRVYDNLLMNQAELDSESKLALYSDLWDLYST